MLLSLSNQSRDPGAEIKRQLRYEVNFGCPVDGCGSPILTYHHFDPPWAGNFQHNVAGMVALCKVHHDQADGGLFTKERLRQMKINPYVNDSIRVRWPYSPESLVLKVGPCFVVGGGSALRLDGRPVLRFSAGVIERLGTKTVTLDSEIVDATGKAWLRITDNWLDLETANLSDLFMPPQTKEFIAKHNDQSKIKLRYLRKKSTELAPWLRSVVSAESESTTRRKI